MNWCAGVGAWARHSASARVERVRDCEYSPDKTFPRPFVTPEMYQKMAHYHQHQRSVLRTARKQFGRSRCHRRVGRRRLYNVLVRGSS